MGKAFQLTKEISSPGDNLGSLLEKKLVAIFRGYFHSYKLPLFLLVQFAKGFFSSLFLFPALKICDIQGRNDCFFHRFSFSSRGRLQSWIIHLLFIVGKGDSLDSHAARQPPYATVIRAHSGSFVVPISPRQVFFGFLLANGVN